MKVSFSLGRGSFGRNSGNLSLVAEAPGQSVTTPSALVFAGLSEDVQLVEVEGALRQAKSPQALADIVTLSATEFAIRYYVPLQIWWDGDIYQISTGEQPFSTATVAQVGSTNHFTVTVTRESQTSVYDYLWSSATGGWTLTSGSGSTTRKESIVWNNSRTACTNTITDGAGNPACQRVDDYQELTGLGRVLVRRVEAPESLALTTQWFYYSNASTDGTNYGQVSLIVEPSGYWRRYEYDTNALVSKEITPFLNAATNAAESECRVTEYQRPNIYGALRAECRVERLSDVEVSRSYTIEFPDGQWQILCPTVGAAWDASDNQVTITRSYDSGAYDASRVITTLRPDGLLSVSHSATNGTTVTNISLSGLPDASGTNIVTGTRTITIFDGMGRISCRQVSDVAPGRADITTGKEDYTYGGDWGRDVSVVYLDGTSRTTLYGCCGVASQTDREGVATDFLYDALHRQYAAARAGVITGQDFDAAGRVIRTWRQPTSGPVVTLSGSAYDTAGRLLRQTNALEGVTSYVESFNAATGETTKTTTYPDHGTRVEVFYRDGSLQSATGTAVAAVYHAYGADANGTWSKETKGTANGSEWVTTYTDRLGRNYQTLYPGNATAWSSYNSLGQLERQVDPDVVTNLFRYNPLGELELSVVDMDGNGLVDTNGADRITQTVRDLADGYWRTRTFAWKDGASTGTLLSTSETSLDGLTQRNTLPGSPSSTVVTAYVPAQQQREVTATALDGTKTITLYTNGRLASVTRKDNNDNTLHVTTYGYDTHGRQATIVDSRNGNTTLLYNAADLVVTNLAPAPAFGATVPVTVYFYNPLGRQAGQLLPDGTTVTNLYLPSGLLQKTWGSRNYPVEYGYDYAGRMTNMTTWQDFNATTGAGISGSATTHWIFDAARGWLTAKRYADHQGPDYTYTNGLLLSRAWARGVTTTYAYNAAGELRSVDYSDSTPDLAYGYDRLGRQQAATNGPVALGRLYSDTGLLLSEHHLTGPLAGLSVTNRYDEYLRRTNLLLRHPVAGILNQADYAFDAAGRLASVSSGGNTAAYGYLANSPLVEHIWFTNGSTLRMTTTKQYDFLNRLTRIESAAGSSNVSVSAYQYNLASQRTALTNADSSYWIYTYDPLGQVTSGKKYWSNGAPVAGQQFEYGFDDIGNRQSAASGGNATGGNLREQSYSANLLNQYTSRTVPGYVDVLGKAASAATVTVWGDQSIAKLPLGTVGPVRAERQGDYWRAEVPINNSTGAVWLTVTNWAVLNQGTNADLLSSLTGSVLVAQSPEAFTYDLDGNLTSDSLWTNIWNGENRRVTVESAAGVASSARAREQWTFLPDGRWIERIVSTSNGSAYYAAYTNRYVWDGNVLLAVLDHTNGLSLSFTRGLDLSGTAQGAGGTGGLLWVSDPSTINDQPSTHCASFDGNGNVTALVNLADGTTSAEYAYGPFAEPLQAIGPMAKANPLRFSTQYANDVTGDLNYLFRAYTPRTGRWLSRDPLDEEGANLIDDFENIQLADTERGLNPVCFVQNSCPNCTDEFGLSWNDPFCCCNPQKTDEGKAALISRYQQAHDQYHKWGITHKGRPWFWREREDKVSCYDANWTILSWMAPTPPCWSCQIEHRGATRWRVGGDRRVWDHWAIVCVSHPTPFDPYRIESILFDFWGNRPAGEDPNTWFRQNFPLPFPIEGPEKNPVQAAPCFDPLGLYRWPKGPLGNPLD